MARSILRTMAIAGICVLASTATSMQSPVEAVSGACAPAAAGTGAVAAIPPVPYADATGTLRATMIFVDFPDAPSEAADRTTTAEYEAVLDGGGALLETASHGALDLQIDAVDGQWFEMPSDSDTYGWEDGVTFDEHRAYIADAVAASDAAVDYSSTDLLYIVPSDNADAISFSPAFLGGEASGVPTDDGVTIGLAVTLGQDMFGWGPPVVDHETGHLLGLPDLYAFTDTEPIASLHRYVGGFDVMGLISGASPDLLAWHKVLLGWLDDADVQCVTDAGDTPVELLPLANPDGVRAALVPLEGDRVLGIEYRDGSGLDVGACATGVLIYEVDQRVASGAGPIRVVDANPDTTPDDCLPLDDAPFGTGEVWTSESDGVSVQVGGLGDTASVTVTRDQGAEPEPDPTEPEGRVAGPTRFDTAVEASRLAYPQPGSAGAVVLARADGFADALAGTPLAVDRSGPILLTRTGSLPTVTAEEIDRVLPPGGRVYVLGGEAAISAEIEAGLRDEGLDVIRLGGPDRYQTARLVATELGSPSDVLLASGVDFPDAVTSGAAAASVGGAVLLTADDRAVDATTQYLAEHPGGNVWAIGGPAARAYPDATAIVGSDRHATSVDVARTFFDQPTHVGLARGDDFPDSLAGGAVLGALGGPIVLTPTTRLDDGVRAWLCEGVPSSAGLLAFGGEAALSTETIEAATAARSGDNC